MSTRPRTPGHGAPGPGKLPITELLGMKESHSPIAMITAYDAPSGRLADAAGADMILVGDSAAMTMLGHDSTVPATMEEMLVLTRAVTRGANRPLVVADMPFGSFQISDELAVTNAVRFVKDAGADAVKLEGAGTMLSRVHAIVGAGVPVMGHIGLTPQSATALGGFKAQGRTASKAAQLVRDALALEAAGCFSIVLEAVPSPVAAKITELLQIPTIGIGAGGDVDGQVLVWHDLLGLYDGHAPRFVKQYAQLATEIQRAVEEYVGDVRARRFPEEVHTYGMPEEELAAFEAELGSFVEVSTLRTPGSRDVNPGEWLKPLATTSGRQNGERRDDHRGQRERAGDAAPRQLECRPQAERQQPERPERECEPDRENDGTAGPVVRAPGAEPVVPEGDEHARAP